MRKKYQAKDNVLLKNGGTQQYEAKVKNMRGEFRDVIFNKAAFLNEHREVIGLIGTILDITNQKRAGKKLRVNERILNATGKMAKIGGWEHDLETGESCLDRSSLRYH